MQSIVIRAATPADGPALHRLAALDSQPPLEGRALVGEVGGVVRAAVAVDDGRAIADPFAPTAELVALLRMRARSLRDAHSEPRGGSARRLRLPQLPTRRRPATTAAVRA